MLGRATAATLLFHRAVDGVGHISDLSRRSAGGMTRDAKDDSVAPTIQCSSYRGVISRSPPISIEVRISKVLKRREVTTTTTMDFELDAHDVQGLILSGF